MADNRRRTWGFGMMTVFPNQKLCIRIIVLLPENTTAWVCGRWLLKNRRFGLWDTELTDWTDCEAFRLFTEETVLSVREASVYRRSVLSTFSCENHICNRCERTEPGKFLADPELVCNQPGAHRRVHRWPLSALLARRGGMEHRRDHYLTDPYNRPGAACSRPIAVHFVSALKFFSFTERHPSSRRWAYHLHCPD